MDYKPNTPHVGVGIIAINDENKILVIKRADKLAAGRGTWALPGGAVDYNEHFMETGKRELKEETGLILVDPIVFAVTNDPSEQFHWVTITVLGKVKNTNVKLDNVEVDEFRWCSPDKIPKPWFRVFEGLVNTPEWEALAKILRRRNEKRKSL